jgi:hypothetical protein
MGIHEAVGVSREIADNITTAGTQLVKIRNNTDGIRMATSSVAKQARLCTDNEGGRFN